LGAHYAKKGIETLKQYDGRKMWVSHECLHLGYESSFVKLHDEN
jgi:3-deoxy-7-phosphoheptulonate synthase